MPSRVRQQRSSLVRGHPSRQSCSAIRCPIRERIISVTFSVNAGKVRSGVV